MRDDSDKVTIGRPQPRCEPHVGGADRQRDEFDAHRKRSTDKRGFAGAADGLSGEILSLAHGETRVLLLRQGKDLTCPAADSRFRD